jgi:WD40 repeat protein
MPYPFWSMLVTRWTTEVGRDWVTAIALAGPGTFVVGTRGGLVAILDEHGNLRSPILELDSWVGAAKPMIDQRGKRYVLLGTKLGTLELLELVEARAGATLEKQSAFSARNAVRDISVWTSRAGDTYFAFGSEDRTIRFGELERVLEVGLVDALSEVSVNGWVRAVAFCFPDPETDLPLIAGGCGDKHVHIFDLQGHALPPTDCASKVHALLSSGDGFKLFATSDSRTLFELTRPHHGRELSVLKRIPLPERATMLEFLDEGQLNLLFGDPRFAPRVI